MATRKAAQTEDPPKKASTLLYIGDTLVDLDVNQLSNKEGIAVEKALGEPLAGWTFPRTMLQMTALVWITRCRTEAGLRFDDVEYRIGDTRDPDEEADPTPAAEAV